MEAARGPQLLTMRKVEVEMGWARGSQRLSSACQVLFQVGSFISRCVLSTYYMPGSVLGARDSGVNNNSVPALLECTSYLNGTR